MRFWGEIAIADVANDPEISTNFIELFFIDSNIISKDLLFLILEVEKGFWAKSDISVREGNANF